MGFSKYSILVVLALAVVALLWVYGRTAFSGLAKWLLWALGALNVCAGLLVLLASEGKPLAMLGGFILWVFAAYTIRVAESSRKRS